MDFCPLRIESHGNRLDHDVASTRNSDTSRRDIDLICVHRRWVCRITEEPRGTNREEYGGHVETDQQAQRENAAKRCERVEFPLVDLIAEANFFCTLQRVF